MQHAIARSRDRIAFTQLSTPRDDISAEVLQGLRQRQKTLSPKFFYDKRGSELFDAITELPEYYPTRTEIGLLKQHAGEIATLLGRGNILFELGSGSSTKIRLLLETLRPRLYAPMDISGEHLLDAAERLVADYPWLDVHAICVDYSRPWRLHEFAAGVRQAFFPGSSIGNFEPHAALILLQQVRRNIGERGGLLIGVDLKKDPVILERAYNDAQGVTAAFNLNLLAHLNRRLQANFELEHFAHRAFYNAECGRIEMHLQCRRDHCVEIAGQLFSFRHGETLHTENSYKYTVEEFQALASLANFRPVRVWTDPDALFSLHYLEAC